MSSPMPEAARNSALLAAKTTVTPSGPKPICFS
jgi:hypothetical protein